MTAPGTARAESDSPGDTPGGESKARAIAIGWITYSEDDPSLRNLVSTVAGRLLAQLQRLAPDFSWSSTEISFDQVENESAVTQAMSQIELGARYRDAHYLNLFLPLCRNRWKGPRGRNLPARGRVHSMSASSLAMAWVAMLWKPAPLISSH